MAAWAIIQLSVRCHNCIIPIFNQAIINVLALMVVLRVTPAATRGSWFLQT
jgi:hypothetical protein